MIPAFFSAQRGPVFGMNWDNTGEETVVWRVLVPELGNCTVNKTGGKGLPVKVVKH